MNQRFTGALSFERRVGLGVIVLMHAALLHIALSGAHHTAPAVASARQNNIQWLQLQSVPVRASAASIESVRQEPPRVRHPAAMTIHALSQAIVAPSVETQATPAPAETPRARSAADILQQARRDIGTIDRDLRLQSHEPLMLAPVDTPQKRLERGIADAASAVPNHWFEVPKTTELIDANGRKIYKVTGASGTYCIYPGPNPGQASIDTLQHSPGTTTGTCPG